MKKSTKILALLLALLMALTVFTACDKKDSDDKEDKKEKTEETAKPKKTDEDKVREVIENFCDDITAGKLDALEDYYAEGADLSFLDELNFAEQFEGAEEIGLTEADVDTLIKDVLKTIEFEIGDIEVSGDSATAAVTVTAPDVESLDFDSMGEDLMMKFMEQEGYSLEELSEMSEEEIMAIMPEMIKWMVNEAVASAPVTTKDDEFKLEKDGENWLIVE